MANRKMNAQVVIARIIGTACSIIAVCTFAAASGNLRENAAFTSAEIIRAGIVIIAINAREYTLPVQTIVSRAQAVVIANKSIAGVSTTGY